MERERTTAGSDRGSTRGLVQPQMLALVIIGVFLGWMVVNQLGRAAGLPPGLALVADLVCLGVLSWALVRLIGIWRMRREEGR